MSEPIAASQAPTRKRSFSKAKLFLVGVIIAALALGGLLYYAVKTSAPKTNWNSVSESEAMPTNTAVWTSPDFEITRKLGLRWYGEEGATENAYCNVTIYTQSEAIVQTVKLSPSHCTVTEVNVGTGNYHVTAEIIGAVPSDSLTWQISVFDQA